MLPEGWGGCSQCLATNLSGSSAGGNPAEMLGQPKHAASPVPGSHAGSCLKHFLQSVHLDITASSGKGVFSVQLHDRRPFQLLSHWALEMGQAGLHSPFLWLKGRNRRERTLPHVFLRPSEVEAGTAQSGGLNSFGLKPVILNLLRLQGGSLCMGWEWFPGLGLRGACPRPSAQWQSLSPVKHTPSLGLQ